MSWSPDGFNKPKSMYWRKKDGTETYIPDLDDEHLLNCMKFLEKKFTKEQVEMWPVYKNLLHEAMGRDIDDRTEWDN